MLTRCETASSQGSPTPAPVLRQVVIVLTGILWAFSSVILAQQVSHGAISPPADSLIQVLEDRGVNINTRGLATIEPHLVADLRDSNHLLAGVFLVSKLGDPRNPNFVMDVSCAVLDSRDAGETWLRHDFAQQGCGDPWVALVGDRGAVF